jgi:membrane protease YdiL (CAAX protease family)
MSNESPETNQQKTSGLIHDFFQHVAVKIVGFIGLAFGIFMFGQIIPVVFLVTVASLVGMDSDRITNLLETNAPIQMLVSLGIAAFSTYLVWQFLRWRRHNIKDFLLLKKFPNFGQLGEVVLAYGVYFIVLIISSVLVGALTTVDVNQAQELGVAATAGSGLIFTFVMLVVIPPIYEEIFFRGFLYRYLASYGGKIVGYALTSILFGIAHLEFGNLNWIAAIDTLLFSGFLIYISQKHQSLYSAMLLHAMKNGIAFYVLFIR